MAVLGTDTVVSRLIMMIIYVTIIKILVSPKTFVLKIF